MPMAGEEVVGAPAQERDPRNEQGRGQDAGPGIQAKKPPDGVEAAIDAAVSVHDVQGFLQVLRVDRRGKLGTAFRAGSV